ncbi:MAG TPA: DUF1015 family protein [Candidatus Acidoferrum sp.]|nr:DUF1015 family protein [Candidatus Acidoferrum sp.]
MTTQDQPAQPAVPAPAGARGLRVTVEPFAALRPDPNLAGKICELPYDVMSSDEAHKIAAGNPLSFLHVSKPEIDLPAGTDLYAPEVYAKGRENFLKLIQGEALKQDSRPCFYLYRQVMGQHEQTGLVATASCEEYLAGAIKKHELTRPDKEDDRVQHIEALNAQTGPVFLTYRADAELDRFVAGKISETPAVDFVSKDGVRHTSWVVAEAKDLKFVEARFARISSLYIADGHHRCAAAARVWQSRRGAGQSGRFLAVIFPHHQMQILPYNRVVKDLGGHSPEQLLEALKAQATRFVPSERGRATPSRKHEVGFYFQGQWRTFSLQPQASPPDTVENLDVTLLQRRILEPVFGIEDPRTSRRLNFVGGIRGTAELERLVNSGEYVCAFSLFPTSIEDLMAVADAGGIMPPKSTWFEPKLRDAMFCHLI